MLDLKKFGHAKKLATDLIFIRNVYVSIFFAAVHDYVHRICMYAPDRQASVYVITQVSDFKLYEYFARTSTKRKEKKIVHHYHKHSIVKS